MRHATIQTILAAKKYFDANPNGKINTGMWTNPTFNKSQFYSWFMKCLHEKTGGSELTERQINKIHDARIINDYYQKRIVRRGCNILNDPKYKKLYPHINTPENDF